MKAKKIGVITFSNTLDNYGQVLQYLATQEYLTQRGHYVFLYQSLGHKKWSMFRLKRKINKIICRVFNLFKKSSSVSTFETPNEKELEIRRNEEEKSQTFRKWAEITLRYESSNPRYFDEFRSRYFHTMKCYHEDLKGIYSFAVGSDQTWSYLSEETMIDFPPSTVHRFSLAPSVGHKIFTHEEINRAKKSLKKFDFITVREQNGLDFCYACDRIDAQLILDPCFLLSDDYYNKFANPQGLTLSKPYVFLYLLGGEIEPSVMEIFTWAKDNKLEVVYVASQGREDDFPKNYATIEQWLFLLSNAKYVFTNSYHGMALSIIYHKQFLVFPLIGLMQGMNGRILYLSQTNKLDKRIYKGDLDEVTAPIDWSYADENIHNNHIKIDELLKKIKL